VAFEEDEKFDRGGERRLKGKGKVWDIGIVEKYRLFEVFTCFRSAGCGLGFNMSLA
jgi:hypothetical protein